jgi:putative endonuclease
MEQYFVYILTSRYNKVLYVGVTNNLVRRVYEHKNKLISGFTSKYNVNKLVYYESFPSVFDAIKREKEIKGWKREKKVALINSFNPEWKDLYEELI